MKSPILDHIFVSQSLDLLDVLLHTPPGSRSFMPRSDLKLELFELPSAQVAQLQFLRMEEGSYVLS